MDGGCENALSLTRNRKFESISLQRRVRVSRRPGRAVLLHGAQPVVWPFRQNGRGVPAHYRSRHAGGGKRLRCRRMCLRSRSVYASATARREPIEPVPPRLTRNTIIVSTFEAGRRFRCKMQINCGELDP